MEDLWLKTENKNTYSFKKKRQEIVETFISEFLKKHLNNQYVIQNNKKFGKYNKEIDVVIYKNNIPITIIEAKTYLDSSALEQSYGRAHVVKNEYPNILYFVYGYEYSYNEELKTEFIDKVDGIYGLKKGKKTTLGETKKLLKNIESINHHGRKLSEKEIRKVFKQLLSVWSEKEIRESVSKLRSELSKKHMQILLNELDKIYIDNE